MPKSQSTKHANQKHKKFSYRQRKNFDVIYTPLTPNGENKCVSRLNANIQMK